MKNYFKFVYMVKSVFFFFFLLLLEISAQNTKNNFAVLLRLREQKLAAANTKFLPLWRTNQGKI